MSDYKEQKAVKPQIEDVINDLLPGNRKQDALDFLDFIKSLKMKPQKIL